MDGDRGKNVFSGIKDCLDEIDSDILKEQISSILEELEKRLSEKKILWKKSVDSRNREVEKWKAAFKSKEKELKNIKEKNSDLIFLPTCDFSRIVEFLI